MTRGGNHELGEAASHCHEAVVIALWTGAGVNAEEVLGDVTKRSVGGPQWLQQAVCDAKWFDDGAGRAARQLTSDDGEGVGKVEAASYQLGRSSGAKMCQLAPMDVEDELVTGGAVRKCKTCARWCCMPE